MYLVGLNLQQKPILIVGGGAVAERKTANLLAAGAQITIVAPEVTEHLAQLVADGLLAWERTPYSTDYLERIQPALVFAATDDAELNAQIAEEVRKLGAWANNASDSAESDFHSLATIDRAPIQIGISSGGVSPALLSQLRTEIDASIGDEWVTLASWLGEIRVSMKTSIGEQSDRSQLYKSILQSDVVELLRSGETQRARQQFDALVADALALEETP